MLRSQSLRLWLRSEFISLKSHKWDSLIIYVGTAILLFYCSPCCSDARQVDFFATAFSWNGTRKPRRPANSGDIERRYSPGCHWARLACYSRYPNHRETTQSLPCVSDHNLTLSPEYIVSILSVQPYVLCSHLHSGLTNGTQRTLLSVDDRSISSPWYFWQSSPSMWV